MLRIKKLGLEQEVIRLRSMGLSSRDISKEFRKKEMDISHMSVERFLNSSNDISREVISKNYELKEKLVSQKLNVHDQIIDTCNLLKRRIEELDNSKDHRALQGYIRELREQLHLIVKLSGGDLTNNNIEKQEINLYQLNQAANSIIVQLADAGKIQILDPELKETYDRTKRREKMGNY